MKRSRIQPRYTTFRQKQKSHFAPKYRACLQCGCNANKCYSELGKEAEKDILVLTTIRKFGSLTTAYSINYKVVYFCGSVCLKKFIQSHKLDLLEEITK